MRPSLYYLPEVQGAAVEQVQLEGPVGSASEPTPASEGLGLAAARRVPGFRDGCPTKGIS